MTNVADWVSKIEQSEVFDLEHPRRMHDPTFAAHWPGLIYSLYRRHEPGLERRTSASGLIVTAEHAGTHMDALCHQAEDMQLFGGITVTPEIQTPAGFTRLGIDTVAPTFCRGVLLDVAAKSAGKPRTLISADDLMAVQRQHAIHIDPGDVVLVRTGYGAMWADGADYLDAPGLDGTASEWLASQELFAVGSDNVAWDLPGFVDPGTRTTLPGHIILLVRHGIHIIENLNLESLARSQPQEFIFVVIPLKFQGGTGSPVRPLAIIPPSIA